MKMVHRSLHTDRRRRRALGTSEDEDERTGCSQKWIGSGEGDVSVLRTTWPEVGAYRAIPRPKGNPSAEDLCLFAGLISWSSCLGYSRLANVDRVKAGVQTDPLHRCTATNRLSLSTL
jgi:hypothetical protein